MHFFSEKLEQDKSIEALKLLIEHFKDKYSLSSEDIIKIIEKERNQEKNYSNLNDIYIPLFVFSNNKLSSLEIIVKYLKENLNKSYHEIAVLLNRDDRTIWATYNNSLKKQKKKFILKFKEKKVHYNFQSKFQIKFQNKTIPLYIFYDRKASVLETLVIYLKENLGFKFKEISKLLLKDYQTIYTSYRNGKKRWEK